MKNNELENLYELYYVKVYSFLKKLSDDNGIAEDLTQETFVLALLKLPEEIDYILPWLYKVARNLYIDLTRKNGRELLNSNIEIKGDEASDDPLERLMAKEKGEILKEALGRLSDGERKIVICFYLKELSIREVGALFDLSVGAVKVSLYRARKKLLKELEKEEKSWITKKK